VSGSLKMSVRAGHRLRDAPGASLLVADGDGVRGAAAEVPGRQDAFVPRLRFCAAAAEAGWG